MRRPGHRGGRHDQGCQLCFAELAVDVVGGFRLGERCRSRLMQIAADAAHPIEREVQGQLAGGIQCRECGTVLLVDEERLALSCPNGHPVELIPAPSPTAAARVVRSPSLAGRPCHRCGNPVERKKGQRGATPKYHPECRSPEELAALEAQRAESAAYYANNKSKWVEWADRKRGRRLASPANPSAIPAE